MSQYNVPHTDTGALVNLLTSRSSMRELETFPVITRPVEAPMSTAATTASITQVLAVPPRPSLNGCAEPHTVADRYEAAPPYRPFGCVRAPRDLVERQAAG